jgi:hypothetical protein
MWIFGGYDNGFENQITVGIIKGKVNHTINFEIPLPEHIKWAKRSKI